MSKKKYKNLSEIEKIKTILSQPNEENNRTKQNHIKELAKQQKKWYAKLKQKNFIDIELHYKKSPVNALITPILTPLYPKTARQSLATVQNYYDQCLDHLNTHRFDCSIEKTIWRLHCAGISYRKMIPKIMQFHHKKVSIWWISQRINKHLKLLKSSQALKKSINILESGLNDHA